MTGIALPLRWLLRAAERSSALGRVPLASCCVCVWWSGRLNVCGQHVVMVLLGQSTQTPTLHAVSLTVVISTTTAAANAMQHRPSPPSFPHSRPSRQHIEPHQTQQRIASTHQRTNTKVQTCSSTKFAPSAAAPTAASTDVTRRPSSNGPCCILRATTSGTPGGIVCCR